MGGLGDFEKAVEPMAAVVLADQPRDRVMRKRREPGLECAPDLLEDFAQLGSRRSRAQHESASRTARHEIQRDRRIAGASHDPAPQRFDTLPKSTPHGSAERGDRIESAERAEMLA